MTPGPATPEPRRRLHPLSPLLHGAKSIAVIVAALSWQTLSQVGLERFAAVVAVLAVGVVIFAVVGWLNTGYHVVGRELRIQDGLLWRRNRSIPLERLQSVELRRPLLAQLTGLAELRLEVVGGHKTEAPLAYLTVRDAAALRERLLALAGRTEGTLSAQPTSWPAPAPVPERLLARVRNRDVLISQLLTPQAFLLPLGIAFVIIQFVLEPSWTFIGIASGFTAMAGVLLQPARRVLQDWDFRLARDPGGRLVVRYGLVETRSQVVPPHRVQSVGVAWPLLWRGFGWLHLRLDVAGYSGEPSRDEKRSDRLLPVGDFATGRALVLEALPGVDLAALATSPPPPRARWLHPFALRYLGAGLSPEAFVSRWGLVTREMILVPYARLQSVRVVQGPIQRLLRLATVYADTAGGRPGMARDRDLNEAWALAEQLANRARLARAPMAGPSPSSPASPAPGFAPTTYPQAGFAAPAYPQAGYPALPGYPQAVPAHAYPPPTGYPQVAVPPPGYPQPVSTPPAYPHSAPAPLGYPQTAPPTGYPQVAPAPPGYPGPVPPTSGYQHSDPPLGNPQLAPSSPGYTGAAPATSYPPAAPPQGYPSAAPPPGYSEGDFRLHAGPPGADHARPEQAQGDLAEAAGPEDDAYWRRPAE